MLAQELELPVYQGCLKALAWGPQQGHPVLALHGWMDNAGSFGRLAPLMPDCRVVAIDFSGHGHSSFRPPGTWYHFIDLLDDIDASCRHLGWQRVHLLGHSMGGALALLYAAAFPEHVQSLITIDALGPAAETVPQTPARLQSALRARRQMPRQGRLFPTRDAAIAARCQSGDMGQAAAADLAERGLEHLPEGWHWRADRRLRLPSLVRLTEAQVLACIEQVLAPTLVIAAAGSFQRHPRLAAVMQKRAEHLPQGQLVRLPGGHHLHLEDAGACAGQINPFVADNAAA